MMSSIKLDKSPLSCIKDMPIKSDDDKLKAHGYADALCRFIQHADTPITIGIQGGWGSGKTSLFTLMQSKLENEQAALFVTVNAWEHSLFQDKEGQSSVVLSILSGLIDSITKELENPSGYIDKIPKKFLDEVGDGLKKTMKTIGAYLPSLASIAISTATGTTANLAANRAAMQQDFVEIPRLAQEIRNLKKSLSGMVTKITKDGQPLKTVIFIDDLDRVPPSTAVNILDVLKNVFDINNCVFVLAIDYEVIVKGLESKFGKRSDSNEREFRQYFDKIIQIPFTMPVGAYSQAMDALLEDSFNRLDIYNGMEIDKKIINNITKIAKLSTGGIPRSIKRILNTLSLLQYIADSIGETQDNDEKKRYLEIRFIVVSLLINFPEICRRLMEKTNFTSWEIDKLNTPWQLEYYEKYEKELNEIAKNKELELYFNDDWEKIVYCLCSKSAWLKLKAYNVSKIMNTLKNILNDFDNKENISDDESRDDEARPDDLSDTALQALSKVLASISVVSVDMDNADENENFKYDAMSTFMKQIHRELLKGELKDVISNLEDQLYAIPSDANNSIRTYTIPLNKGNVRQISLTHRDEVSEYEITISADSYGKDKEVCNKILKESKKELSTDWLVPSRGKIAPDESVFKLSFAKDMSQNELISGGYNSDIVEAITVFHRFVDNISASLKNIK